MKSAHDHGHDLNVKKIDKLSGTKVRLTLEYSAETVSRHEKMTANRFTQIAKIPGFRPGKAPLKMVTERYKEDILKDVIQHLIESGLAEALEQTKLVPVGRPRLAHVDPRGFGETKPFEFQAELEVEPEIELKNYKGVPVKAEDLKVTDEEVVKTLENIRERLASLEPLPNAKKPEKGDFAVAEIGFEVADGKKEAPKTITAEMGAGRLLNELEAALFDMEVGGEARTVQAKYPEDYDDQSLAGKDVTFQVKLLELKKKVLPALDDALAAQIKPNATLEELKKEIRESIESTKREESQREQRSQVMDYLVANHQFEAPNSLVERQMQSLLQWMIDDMMKRGIKPAPLKEDDIKAVRARAEQMVKSSLILKEIASKEKIELDETRVRQRLEALADQWKRSVEETENLLQERGMLSRLRDEILTDQVFDFLLQHAQRVEGAPRP